MLAYMLYLHTLKTPSENIITFSTVKNNWKKILLYLPRYLTVLFLFLNSKCFMCTFNKKFSFFVKNCFTIIIDQVIRQWILLVFSTLGYIYFMFMIKGYFYWIRTLDWLFSTLKFVALCSGHHSFRWDINNHSNHCSVIVYLFIEHHFFL